MLKPQPLAQRSKPETVEVLGVEPSGLIGVFIREREKEMKAKHPWRVGSLVEIHGDRKTSTRLQRHFKLEEVGLLLILEGVLLTRAVLGNNLFLERASC